MQTGLNLSILRRPSGPGTLYDRLNGIAPVTFFKDYRTSQASADADQSAGSPTATYTATRSPTNPATYFTANGVMQTLTTSNTPRWTAGYYDETGWHAAPGMVVEGAGTNLLKDSYFSQTFATYWRGVLGGTGTQDSTYPNLYGGGTIGKLVATAIGSEFITAVANKFATTSGNKYTLSAFVRGSGGVRLLFKADTGAYQTGSTITLSDAWIFISHTFTSDGTSDANLGIESTDDSAVCYISCIQCTQHSTGSTVARWPDTFIPTTTAVATRNGESISYSGTSNFPAPTGNNTLSFDGADDYVSIPNSTANQYFGATSYSVEAWFFARTLGEANTGRIWASLLTGTPAGGSLRVNAGNTFAHILYEGGAAKSTVTSSTFSPNTWVHVVATWVSGSAAKIYINNTEASYSSAAAATTLENDTAFPKIIGDQTFSGSAFNGFIRRVRVFRNKELTGGLGGDIEKLYNSGTYVQNETAADRGVTGATAEYNFTEGAGTGLSDSTGTFKRLEFNGSTSSVVVSNSATGNQIYGSTAFSLEAWVFARTLGEGSLGKILDKTISGTDGYGWRVATGNTIRFFSFEGGASKIVDTTSTYTPNTWVHLVVSWSSGSAPKIFINSTEASYSGTPGVLTTPDLDSARSLYIGNNYNQTNTFDGYIRRIRIFRNKALTGGVGGDVEKLYNSGTYTQNETAADRGVTGATAEYNMATESLGATTIVDSLGGANGTATDTSVTTGNYGVISGAVWAKDTLAATAFMVSKPIAALSEITSSGTQLFSFGGGGNEVMYVPVTGSVPYTQIAVQSVSNSATLGITVTSPTRTRYADYSLGYMISTEPVETYERRAYINGSSVGTPGTVFAIPVTNPAAAGLKFFYFNTSVANCEVMRSFVIFSRALTAAEVAQVNTLLNA